MLPEVSPQQIAVPFEPEAIASYYRDLLADTPGADASTTAWEDWYWRWNAIKIAIAGEGSRRYLAEAKDTRDPAARAAWRFAREEIFPIQEAGDGRAREALLKSPRRPELSERLGAQLFLRLDLDQAAFDPANIALNTQEGKIVAAYEQMIGAMAVDLDDQPALNLAQLTARLGDPREETRRAAWQGLHGWLAGHAGQLHTFFDQLLGLRGDMARQLGEANYVVIGYRKMGRSDYGPDQVAAFREGIRRHVAPLVADLRAWQARELGTPTVCPWDAVFFPGLSMGPGTVPIEGQLAQARTLFERLHPRLVGHFDTMVAQGLIDLESRPGKVAGAFALSLDDEDRVAIFCNSTGSENDVGTLTHEMGHAFQGWESMAIRSFELRTPTVDAAELHSMGMEFLAFAELEAFFTPDQARRYRRLKLINSLTRLPYIAVVDAFQHWVYTHPGHTPLERDERWCALWDTYNPGIDFAATPADKALRWVRQSHIFCNPFYYIDYALAEVGAMQLWQLAERDREAAMTAYLALCRLGGTRSLLDIFAAAGLRSPFDPDVLAPLMQAIRRELDL